tara:strand:+ start:567 stop:1304 length:738 start_codon:yes stop_codon:yes gene_type:complete
MSFPKIFKPEKQYKLVRLGKDHDGGYLVGENSIKNSEVLISFGINDDWSFEKDFINKNNSLTVWCYDDKPILKFLIKKLIINIVFFLSNFKIKKISDLVIKIFDYFRVKKIITFKKKKISYNDLNEIISNFDKKKIFLKIDIEGFEYRIIDEILENQSKFVGIIIEFHNVDYHVDLISNFINSLDLKLVHIHPNNSSIIDKNNDPTILEMSFEKNDITVNNEINLPHELDMRNDPSKEDVFLKFK